MPNIPVAIVSGAVTAGIVRTDILDGEEWQIIKVDLGAASASNPLIGGQRDTENSISIVGASGALFNVAASVRGNVAASVAGTVVVAVSAGQIVVTNQVDVSAHGLVSAGGHSLVSADGTVLVNDVTLGSAAVTANGGRGTLIMGVTPASVQTFFLVDSAGRQVVAVSGGQIVVSNTVDVSARVIDVSSRQIDVSAHGIVTAAGHVLVSGDGIFTIAGNVASDAADAGNPVKIGGIVVVSANPASAAASDRVNATFDKVGRQIIVNQQARELVTQAVATVESAVQRTIFASGGVGIFNDLTSLDVTNAAATAVTMFIADASGAPVLIYNLAAGGGFIKTFQPPWKQTTPDRVWSVTITPSVASFVFVNAQAVQNT